MSTEPVGNAPNIVTAVDEVVELVDNGAAEPLPEDADKPVYGLGEAPPVVTEVYHVPGNPIPDL